MASAVHLRVTATYTGARGRIDIHIPHGKRFIPLNLRGWHEWEEMRIRVQHTHDGPLRVAILNRDLDPLRPLDLVMAGQAMAEDQAETVVFAPNNNECFSALPPFLKFFFPLFSATDLKEGRSLRDFIETVQRLNTMNNVCNLRFNWIASSQDLSGPIILSKLRAGKSLDEAIDEAVSPLVSRYLYFYFRGEENMLTEALSSGGDRANLIQLADEFYPLSNPHAALIQNGRITSSLIAGRYGPGVTFELPLSKGLH